MIRAVHALAALFLLALPLRAEVVVQEVTSPGGLTAWLVEEHTIPFTALEIRFEGGASLDPAGKRGAMNLMTALIEEGAGDLDARGFAEAREALAASYGFDVYDDALTISAKMLTENRDAAVALLKSALMEPRFDADAIERVREQVQSVIRSNSTDPGQIASDRFNALAWGDHPYGSSSDGTAESVAALGRDDILAARDSILARDRMFVAAVGDITAAELGALLDELLGALPETGAPLPVRATYLLEPGLTVVPFETPQSVAIFGHEGIDRNDDDYIAAYILNEVFGGGGFESRLMQEVREKRGLTYGIGSYLVPMDHGALVLGQFASANGKIAEGVEVVRAEWARIAEGLTQEELDYAKTYLTGAYALRFDGNAPIARILVGMQSIGLPASYITERNALVEAITLEEINRVARALFDPEALHIVVVGQPEGLQ